MMTNIYPRTNMKKKMYIQLIVSPDGSIYDYGVRLDKDDAEDELNQTFDRMKAENKDTFRKMVKEVEIDI